MPLFFSFVWVTSLTVNLNRLYFFLSFYIFCLNIHKIPYCNFCSSWASYYFSLYYYYVYYNISIIIKGVVISVASVFYSTLSIFLTLSFAIFIWFYFGNLLNGSDLYNFPQLFFLIGCFHMFSSFSFFTVAFVTIIKRQVITAWKQTNFGIFGMHILSN